MYWVNKVGGDVVSGVVHCHVSPMPSSPARGLSVLLLLLIEGEFDRQSEKLNKLLLASPTPPKPRDQD